MKLSKDPFEAAFEEESPPVSPSAPDDIEIQTNNPNPNPNPVPVPIPASSLVFHDVDGDDYDDYDDPKQNPHNTISTSSSIPSTSTFIHSNVSSSAPNKTKDDDDEEDEENVEVELAKFPASGDPDKMAKMQAILSQFTEDQMSRYESFRRAGFQKANMKRLLASISGTQKISVPMTIVVSGIAKMFVGELVETARIVMTERKETGPIRPCHLREAYRRQKLEGKIPKKSVPRLFR